MTSMGPPEKARARAAGGRDGSAVAAGTSIESSVGIGRAGCGMHGQPKVPLAGAARGIAGCLVRKAHTVRPHPETICGNIDVGLVVA